MKAIWSFHISTSSNIFFIIIIHSEISANSIIHIFIISLKAIPRIHFIFFYNLSNFLQIFFTYFYLYYLWLRSSMRLLIFKKDLSIIIINIVSLFMRPSISFLIRQICNSFTYNDIVYIRCIFSI